MTRPADLTLLRVRQVLGRRGASRSAHYRDIGQGIWTPPVTIGHTAAWPAYEVDEQIAARIAGASFIDLERLVSRLMERRRALMPATVIDKTEAA